MINPEDINAALVRPFQSAMFDEGISEKYLAKKLKRELNAKVSKTQKLSGATNDLPKSYKLITTTGKIAYEKTKFGVIENYGDGDTLIGWNEIDWATRQKARMDACKLLGAYPAEEHKISGTLTHGVTPETEDKALKILDDLASGIKERQ